MWASGVVRGYNKYESMLGTGVELHSSTTTTAACTYKQFDKYSTCTVVYCVLVQQSLLLVQAALLRARLCY